MCLKAYHNKTFFADSDVGGELPGNKSSGCKSGEEFENGIDIKNF
jgi:hypothetical protein